MIGLKAAKSVCKVGRAEDSVHVHVIRCCVVLIMCPADNDGERIGGGRRGAESGERRGGPIVSHRSSLSFAGLPAITFFLSFKSITLLGPRLL